MKQRLNYQTPSPSSQVDPRPANRRSPWRPLLAGIILIPINCYFIMDGGMWRQTRPTTVSLFVNVIASMFLVCLVNMAVRRINRRWAMTHGELCVLYTMMSVASAICGLDMMQAVISFVTDPFWLASPENHWRELFLNNIPHYFSISDKKVLEGFFGGHTTMFQPDVLRAWFTPFLVWGGLILVLSVGMLCINTIVRKDWTQKSKLSFPIVQLPLEMTRQDFSLWRNRLMWMGFAVAGIFDLVNGLNFLYPSLPSLGGRLVQSNLQLFLPGRPWNAIGWTPYAIFPFAIGLAFFMPLDLSFSCWFFYIFWKLERVASSAFGWGDIPRFPYVEEQNFAAYVTFCLYTLWVGRTHLREVFRKALGKASEVDDSGEPMSYRTALILLLICFGLLSAGGIAAGLSPWVAVLFFIIYYIITTSITRIRAELGSPVHDLHFAGPHIMISEVFGMKLLGAKNLAVMALGESFNRAYRGLEMPHQLEGMKLAEQTGMSQRSLLKAILVAIVLGIASSYWSMVGVSYHYQGRTGFSGAAINRSLAWMNNPTGLDYSKLAAMAVGALTTMFLMMMRLRYVWWPFHPAGYAISGSWSMNLFWLSIFIAWAIKASLFRYAGMNSYRKAMPFFLGLILGEFVVGTFWSVYGCIRQMPMYNFLP